LPAVEEPALDFAGVTLSPQKEMVRALLEGLPERASTRLRKSLS
jgi:hypothetical protein